MEWNPYLKPWRRPEPNRAAGKGEIERPGDGRNIVWQTRSAAPTEYENQLADALEAVFESGATELTDIVAGLNQRGVRHSDGQPWTEASFRAEMQRLGAQ